MADEKLSRGDYLLSRILARLGLLRANEVPIVAPRFRRPSGNSAAGTTFKGTIANVTGTAGKFVEMSPNRYAILMSQQSGATCRIWINGSMGATGGFPIPSSNVLEFNRDSHGDLAGAELWVLNPLGATTFSFIEIF